MSVNERLMADGSWSVSLVPEVPSSIIAQSRLGNAMFVTPAELPPSMQTLSSLLASSRYTGVLTEQKERDFSGFGLLWYLGNSQQGAVINATSGWQDLTFDFRDWVRELMDLGAATLVVEPCPYTEGTIYDFDATTYEMRISGQLRRPFLDRICQMYHGMYQVRADNTFHAGRQEDLFASATKEVIILPKGGVRDISLAGLRALEMKRGWDVGSQPTGWFSVGAGEGTSATIDYTPTSISPYNDLLGQDVVRAKIVNAPDAVNTAEAAAVGVGELLKDLFTTGSLDVSTDTHDIGRFLTPGDIIYVYDPRQGLFDADNQVRHAGEVMFPTVRMVQAVTWPIEEGMGVYIRSSTTGAVIDLTPYIEWESAPVRFELGGYRRRLVAQVENPANERRLR